MVLDQSHWSPSLVKLSTNWIPCGRSVTDKLDHAAALLTSVRWKVIETLVRFFTTANYSSADNRGLHDDQRSLYFIETSTRSLRSDYRWISSHWHIYDTSGSIKNLSDYQPRDAGIWSLSCTPSRKYVHAADWFKMKVQTCERRTRIHGLF